MDLDIILEVIRDQATKPLSFEEIAKLYPGIGKNERRLLHRRLDALVKEGLLVQTRKNRYAMPEAMNLVVGRLVKNKKGFGFLVTDDPDEEDLFIPAGDLNGAYNQDRVMVRVMEEGGAPNKRGNRQRTRGKVIRILERAQKTYLGTFVKRKHYGLVRPDDVTFGEDIFIEKKAFNEAKDGDKVLVDISQWPGKNHGPEGVVREIIGRKGDPGVDVLSIVYHHHLRATFPPKVKRQAERMPILVGDEETEGRRDLRYLPFVTIDGADAKDLDDAIFLEVLDNGHYFLTVAIADVGHYVSVGGKIDEEAFKRGTSVYLVDRVLPMLPEELSNGICSLHPGVDRLVLACTMEIDQKGVVVASEIYEAVISSIARLTYDGVNDLYEDKPTDKIYRELRDFLFECKDLQEILYRRRKRRGAIEFDIPESRVRLDDKGKPLAIEWRKRGLAQQVIEECMIVTNETVAQHYYWLQTPFIYRVHEKPEEEKIADVRSYLQAFGVTLPERIEGLNSKDYQKVLAELPDDDSAYAAHMVLLRSMRHAYYSTNALGHFGLASQYYTHFTSPIRRYSDLSTHRVIKEMLRARNHLDEKRRIILKEQLAKAAEQASMTERVAEAAERDSQQLKKVEYMQDYVGDIFPGRIVSVTGFGFFVQLENSVEGLVHISSLVDDFYQFDPMKLHLIGEHKGRVFAIGDHVKVRLADANVETMQIDFEWLEEDADGDEDDQ